MRTPVANLRRAPCRPHPRPPPCAFAFAVLVTAAAAVPAAELQLNTGLRLNAQRLLSMKPGSEIALPLPDGQTEVGILTRHLTCTTDDQATDARARCRSGSAGYCACLVPAGLHSVTFGAIVPGCSLTPEAATFGVPPVTSGPTQNAPPVQGRFTVR